MHTYYQPRMVFGGGSITPAVKTLIIVNVAVFLLRTMLDYNFDRRFGLVPYLVWERLYLWQLFTYQFLHGGIAHILFNMLALWMFGCGLERLWGSRFFTKYYFVSAVGGGILNAVLLPDQTIPSIGASAGVYGILLAYGLIYPNQIIYFYFFFPLKMKHFVLIIGAIAFYSSIAATHSGIADLAHLGGMAFGYAYLRWGNPLKRLRSYWGRQQRARQRRKFRVLNGKSDDDDEVKPTLH